MRYLKTIKQVLAAVAEPLRRNCTFAVFMYLLGCITAWATLPNVRGAHLYDNLYLELFLDVYVLTLILTLLPRKVMIWVRGFFYVVLYATAVVDVYCFVKFQSTLTPTMLQLVGETDSRESGEFLRSCVSPDVLMSDVGWVLLLLFVHVLTALRRDVTGVQTCALPISRHCVYAFLTSFHAVGASLSSRYGCAPASHCTAHAPL